MDFFEKQQRVEALRGIVKARWSFIVIIVFLGLALKLGNTSWSPNFSYWKIAALALFAVSYNVSCWFFARRPIEKIGNWSIKIVSALQVIVEQVLYTLIFYYAGTVESTAFLLYFVTILVASSLFKTKGIILSGLLAVFLFSGAVIADFYGWVPHVASIKGVVWFGNPLVLQVYIISFSLFMLGTIFFSAFLSSLLRKREQNLREQRDQFADQSRLLATQTKVLVVAKEELAKANLDLEEKVEERTKKLKEQRDQLYEATVALSKAKKNQEIALIEATAAKKKADSARLAILNILEDVEESRRGQEVEKNKIEAVFKSLTDGLITLDQYGLINLMNSQAEEILNVKKEDVIGRVIRNIDAGEFKNLNQLLEKEGASFEKQEIILGEPRKGVIEVSTALVVDFEGKAMGRLIILHDITREKEIEKMKSEFVSVAAHQLRTPLSAIKWTLRLVLDKDLGPVSKEQEDVLQKGYQSNERMICLINDLLNVARIEEGRTVYKHDEVDLLSVIPEVLEGVQSLVKSKNIKIILEKPTGNSCRIRADKEKIKMAMENLVENAVNYSPGRSTVTISIDCDKINLTFAVKDSGMGIPKNQQNRIFTKFFRSQNAVRAETEGTGLGLFIAKNIIDAHGGRLWFKSEENKGSSFYFTLPIIK